MNAQTPGPLVTDENGLLWPPDMEKPVAGLTREAFEYGATFEQAARQVANAALFANAYTAFDRAGRELGIDAAELAESIDLAEVIRYALDYAQLNTVEHDKRNVGRPDQTQAARSTLAPLAALLKVDLPSESVEQVEREWQRRMPPA